jgi:hypothetical protein
MNTNQFLQAVMRMMAGRAAECAAYYESWGAEFVHEQLNEAWRDVKNYAEDRRVSVAELRNLTKSQRSALGFSNWDENVVLIPLWAFNYIADGERLIAIDGDEVEKGKDEIDLDVRFGCIAFGFRS